MKIETIRKSALLALYFGIQYAGNAQTITLNGPELGNPTSSQLLAGYSSSLASNPDITVFIQGSGTFDAGFPIANTAGFPNQITGTGTNQFTISFSGNNGWVVDQVILNNYNIISNGVQESYVASVNGALWDSISGPDASHPNLVLTGLGTSSISVDSINASPWPQTFDVASTINSSGISGLTFTYTKAFGNGLATQPLGLTLNVASVPEPSAFFMSCLGSSLVLFRRSRRAN